MAKTSQTGMIDAILGFASKNPTLRFARVFHELLTLWRYSP